MNATTTEAKSLAYVRDAIAAIPSALERSLGIPIPATSGRGSVITTGIGASEGSARLLAERLSEAGIPARFVGLGAFATGTVSADRLIVFSQGLSPNARLAFDERHRFGDRLLVTSVGFDGEASARRDFTDGLIAHRVGIMRIPPATESGTLVRFVGPTVASLTALRLAASIGAADATTLDAAPARYVAAASRPAESIDPGSPIALLGAGVSPDELFGARWKVLETLLRGDPPVWDALGFAHGPVQAMSGRRLTMIVFEIPGSEPLVERLTASIDPDHHRLVRLRASTRDATRLIEHTAALDALLAATLHAHPRDLFSWPGRSRECALYELGEDRS